MSKLAKLAQKLNDDFRVIVDGAFFDKFNTKSRTAWSFFQDRVVSVREDGEDLTPEQARWLEAYSDGYAAAMNIVREAAEL